MAAVTDREREDVLLLRASGMSWARIERELGWPDAHGNRAWRAARGGDSAGRPDGKRAHPFSESISLWKKHDGGLSFKRAQEVLAAAGIPCEKGDPSPWEGRYEIFVKPEDFERASDLLFRPVPDAAFRAQSLDCLSDPSR